MRSVQMIGNRRAIHTVGITEHGILYIDVQTFEKDRTHEANTFYVRAVDVVRIKQRVFLERAGSVKDEDLVRLFAASFRSAEYALEWLRWARIPTVHRHDAGACSNAEESIPPEAMSCVRQDPAAPAGDPPQSRVLSPCSAGRIGSPF